MATKGTEKGRGDEEREKARRAKEKEREKARRAKEKEREKARRAKEKEREKARRAKEKERARERHFEEYIKRAAAERAREREDAKRAREEAERLLREGEEDEGEGSGGGGGGGDEEGEEDEGEGSGGGGGGDEEGEEDEGGGSGGGGGGGDGEGEEDEGEGSGGGGGGGGDGDLPRVALDAEALSEDMDGTVAHYRGDGLTEVVIVGSDSIDLIWIGQRAEMVGLPSMRVHVVGTIPGQAKRKYKSSRFASAGAFDASTRWHSNLWNGVSAGTEVIDSLRSSGIAIEQVRVELQFRW